MKNYKVVGHIVFTRYVTAETPEDAWRIAEKEVREKSLDEDDELVFIGSYDREE